KLNDIQNPNLIYVGEIIKVPITKYVHKTSSVSEYINKRTYIVREGDTLTSIADKFDTTIDELVKLNNIPNPKLIYPGEVLKI
ncbi:MAG: LysM peptidoglycan-binding domain-containing protein, partial [Peptostreptococcaceae bacterium]